MCAELPGKVGKIEREDIIKGQKKILSMEEDKFFYLIFVDMTITVHRMEYNMVIFRQEFFKECRNPDFT